MKTLTKFVVLTVLMALVSSMTLFAKQPSPSKCLNLLKKGNERFIAGVSKHPHTNALRLAQAGRENQGNHAYATVITCSDSRVPVERLFDAGIMDIFVIRVAGNVCDVDEVGSIEYGVAHVNTPVLVILGHTQCGAVTAVTHAINGTGHPLELNIPPLVDNIEPAVRQAMSDHPGVHGDDIIPYAIVQNVWQGTEDLFMRSPATRNLVNSGKLKVVGAIYDVGTGSVRWLPEHKVTQILAKVESNSMREMNAMAGDSHSGSRASTGGSHGGELTQISEASHGSTASSQSSTHGVSSGGHGAASAADEAAVASLLRKAKSAEGSMSHFEKKVDSTGAGNFWTYLFVLITIVLVTALVLFQARVKDEFGETSFKRTLGAKLITGFGVIIILLTIVAAYSVITFDQLGAEIETIAEEKVPLTKAISAIEVHQLEQSIFLERAFRFGEEEGTHAQEKYEESVEEFERLSHLVTEEVNGVEELIKELPAHDEETAEELTTVYAKLVVIQAHHTEFEWLAEQVFSMINAGQFS
ncbi:MAG: hypothetical protein IH931_01930, partial [candidate division Zixibacteria bacterium]|nr:hypothetical protein [candidate division Zixibacteria bacterium]